MSMDHTMPPDTNEKEKIIGGIFTLYQTMWIAGGIVIALVIAMAFFRFFGVFVFIFGIPPIVTGFVFAIKKVNGIPYPKYLRLKSKYKNKIKLYVNSGGHKSLNFSNKE